MRENALEKLTRARAQLLLESPFFGNLALRLMPVEARWQNTMAVDGTHMYFNPDYVVDSSMDHLKTSVAHEVLHCGLGHHTRMGNRDPDQWNVACDFPINGQLQAAGFVMRPGALIDPEFTDLSAEQVYSRLSNKPGDDEDGGSSDEQKPEDDENQDQDDSGQDQDDSGDQQDDGDQDGDGESQDDGDGNQDGDQDGGDGQEGAEGNGDGIETPDGRPASSDPGGCGGVIPPPAKEGKDNPSPADLAESEQEWKIAMQQAAQSARVAGNLPGGIEDLVKEDAQPKADWKALLRQFVNQFAKDDFSWYPPNKRYIHQGIYLPSVRSESVGPMVLAVDTSGSIPSDLLAVFQSELNCILDEIKPELVHVVYCDARVNHSEEFTADELPVELTPAGRGGTAFQPVFDWVEAEEIEPVCLVYLTDMFGDLPTEPDYPVLWCDYDGRAPEYHIPSFGEHVIIEEISH